MLRWVGGARAGPGAVAALASALGLPPALAALLVQRGPRTPGGRPPLPPARRSTELSDPLRLAGMAEAVDAIAAAVRAGGTHPGPRRLRRRRPVRHGAAHPRARGVAGADVVAVRAAPAARRLRLRPRRARGGRRRLGASLIITCDCGITAVETVRARASGAASASWSPTTTCPGAELPPAHGRRRSAAGRRHARARACSAAPASPSSWCRRWCRARACRRTCRYHLLDLVALATVADVVPLLGENRDPGAPRTPAAGRQPLARAPRAARGHRAAGQGDRGRPGGLHPGPAAQRGGPGGRRRPTGSGSCSPTIRRRRPRWPQRLEGLNTERQALDQRILDEALAQVERTGDPERDAGLVLAGDGWHPGVVGIVASRVVERFGRPDVPDRVRRRDRQGLRPEHLALRPACGAARLRRPARALRRPPHGGGAHHPAGPARGVPRALRRPRAARLLAPRTSGPEQRVDLELACTRRPTSSSGSCRHLEPCGAGNAEPGVRGARRALRRPQRGSATATSRACSRTARAPARRHRLPVGRPGAMAGRRPGRRGLPARAQRVERSRSRCRPGCVRCRRTLA